jgi:hypothetical protein
MGELNGASWRRLLLDGKRCCCPCRTLGRVELRIQRRQRRTHSPNRPFAVGRSYLAVSAARSPLCWLGLSAVRSIDGRPLRRAYIRCGSQADVTPMKPNVRYAPETPRPIIDVRFLAQDRLPVPELWVDISVWEWNQPV